MSRPKSRFDHPPHNYYRQAHHSYGGNVPQQGPPPNVAPVRMPNAGAGMRAQGMSRPTHVPQQQQQQPQLQNQQVQQQAHAGGVAVQQHQGYPHVQSHHAPAMYYTTQHAPGGAPQGYIHISPYSISPTTNPGMPLHSLTQSQVYTPRFIYFGGQAAQPSYYNPHAPSAPSQAHQMYAAASVAQQPVYQHHRMAATTLHPSNQAVANAQQLQQAPVAPSHGGVVTSIAAQHQQQHSHQQQPGVPVVPPQTQPMPRQEQERKKRVLKIVDPKTGRQVLDDLDNSSTPAATNATSHSESASAKGASTTDPSQNSVPSSTDKPETQQTQAAQQAQDNQDAKQKDETVTSGKEEPGSAATEKTKNSARTEFFQKIAQASDDTRTSSTASTGNSSGNNGTSGNQVNAETPTPTAEPEEVTRSETPVPSTPKDKSPSPEPSKQLVASTPVANTSSDDSKDASLVSISPTPIENYATPRSRELISSPPLQPQIEKYVEEVGEEEPSEDGAVSIEEITDPEPEPTTEPVSQNDVEEVTESLQEEIRADSELSDSVKQDESEKDDEVEQQDLVEENQPNGHLPLEEGEVRDDDDDDESIVAESGPDEQEDTSNSAKGKIKYDRATLLMIREQKSYNEFEVPSFLQDLGKDSLNNHIKSHGPPMSKNSPGGPRDYGRTRGMPIQGNKPLLPPGMGRMHGMGGMGPMGGWGGGSIVIPPPPPRVQPKVQITLQREEVKLHKAENAWKPATLKRTGGNGEDINDDEQIMIASIVKKTRGILNKLTPDNFDKLVSKFMELPLEDKDERISNVIGVVFEKAIDEPSFSAAYAKMVHTVWKTSQETSKKFRKQILDQCQKEFQKSNTDEAEIKDVEQKLAETTDETIRERLKVEIDEKRYLSRRRSLGNVRFIGELYKLQMLTPKIMVECVQMLLCTADEESLECLCKLLSTVGQRLDSQLHVLENQAAGGGKPKFVPETKWMDKIFGQLRTLSDNKKLSSRIRFAILDVVELRQNDYKPRRDTNAPKTIEEVRKEAHRQEMEEKRQINSLPPVQNSYGGGGDRDHRGGVSRLPGSQQPKKTDWTTVPSNKANRFQTTGKKTEPVGAGGTPVFGPPQLQWGQKNQSGPPSGSSSSQSNRMANIPPRFMNRFHGLSTADEGPKHPNKGSQNSSEPSGYRDQIPMYAPPLLPATSPPPSTNSSAENSRPVSPKDLPESFTADTSESVKNIFQEYLACKKFDDTLHWIRNRFPGNKIEDFVEEMSRQVGEMSKEVEQKSAGSLLRLLIKSEEIQKKTAIRIMAQGVMEDLPDILIDVPKATSYLAQFLVEIFFDESNLDWLLQVGERLIQNEDYESAWRELAVNSLNVLKLRHNDEFVQTSLRKTENRDVIPVDEIPWLQNKTLDSLAEQMVKVLSPKVNSDSTDEIGQIFQEFSWDVREETTARALTEAICTLTWNPETGSWNDERVKKLLPLLALPSKLFPAVWKQVEEYLTKKSIDKKEGEGLWRIMYSLNMTTSSE